MLTTPREWMEAWVDVTRKMDMASLTPHEWIAEKPKERSPYRLSFEWGLAQSSIGRQLNGKRAPSFAMMIKFYDASGGRVDLDGWRRALKAGLVRVSDKSKPKGKANVRRRNQDKRIQQNKDSGPQKKVGKI